jgi:acetoacetate decarboxylase
MPIVFGPTELPQVSQWGYVRALDISFVTDPVAVRPLVPVELDLPDRPTVIISRRSFDKVDYLAGHGYEELCVGISVIHNGEEGPTRGNFWPVMWVDQVRPITVGREFTGFAKLGADFSPIRDQSGELSWEMSEYGTVLARATVRNAKPVDDATLETIANTGSIGYAFCSRYIPPVVNSPGIDEVTRCQMRSQITSVQVGEAQLELASPSWKDAPNGARAMSALAALPILQLRRAMIIEGSSSFDRSTITALPRARSPRTATTAVAASGSAR